MGAKKKPDYLHHEETEDFVVGNIRVGKTLEHIAKGGLWSFVGAIAAVLTLIVSVITLIVTLLK